MDTTSEQPAPRAKAAPDAPPMTAIAPSPRRPAPHEIAAAKARTASRGVSQVIAAMRAARPEPEIEDDATEERWSPERLAAEREAAESNKHAGVMPSPRSTFAVTSKFRGDLNEVRELDFEGGE